MTKQTLSKLHSLAAIACLSISMTGCHWDPHPGGGSAIGSGGADGDPDVESGGSSGASGAGGEEEDPVIPDGFVDCPPAVIGGNCGSKKVCGPAQNGRCQCKSSC